MKSKVLLLCSVMFAISACVSAPTKQKNVGPATQENAELPAAIPELANTSIAELERMVAAGDVKAQVELGSRYALGKGIEKNYDKAVPLFRAAADSNDPIGQYFLGTAYYNGAGVPKDEAMAVIWYERGAAQHFAMASYWLGFMIANGRGGINPTWHGALPYLWDAAIQDNSMAQFLLGYAYDKGTDVDRNVRAAAYWYRRSNNTAFNVLAQNNLLLLINAGEAQWQPGDPGKPPEPAKPTEPAKPAAAN